MKILNQKELKQVRGGDEPTLLIFRSIETSEILAVSMIVGGVKTPRPVNVTDSPALDTFMKNFDSQTVYI